MTVVNTNSHPLSVLIVGCGNIAGRFDQKRPENHPPYTHAGAFTRDARFNLIACIDPDEQLRLEFMERWKVPLGYASIDELRGSAKKFDVISICSPTISHAHDLELALSLLPKLIFCEKPITTLLSEAERLVDICKKADIPVAVNHTRRWDLDILKLRADLNAEKWGCLRSVSALYNKGIMNNGSHLIDLLHFLLGPMRIIKVGRPQYDFFSDDPSVPVWLESNTDVPIQISCAHADDYAAFELQFIFSGGVLTMEEGGMLWRERRAADSDTFKGYRKIGQGVYRSGNYPQAMLHAIDNIYQTINRGMPLLSSVDSALSAQRVCEEIKQQACML
ncbi:putative 4,5-dihydroxyphthalate dehydrogenase [compost metagenome]